MPKTETAILSEKQIAEIETRAAKATKGPWEPYHRISPRGAYKHWHIGNKDGLCQITMNGHECDYNFMAHAREDVPALCQTVRALQTAVHGEIAKVIELQSQFAEVEKELSDEKRLRAELKQIARAGISEVSSVATALGENALIDFRIRAVELCNQRAAEWEATAMNLHGLERDNFLSKIVAARELAEAIKELK